jgi:predicted transglutaminase-like cysteine proteinase
LRRAALVPPTVPQPHAGSWRLLNLAGSRQRQGRALLAEINRAVNFSIRPVSDWAQYGVADFWSAPLATLGAGAGDCEDYAVLKYVALREAGIAPDDLRFLIVYYPRRGTNHVVVAVHLGEEWLILDNSTLIMVNSSDASPSYSPKIAAWRELRQDFARGAWRIDRVGG